MAKALGATDREQQGALALELYRQAGLPGYRQALELLSRAALPGPVRERVLASSRTHPQPCHPWPVAWVLLLNRTGG